MTTTYTICTSGDIFDFVGAKADIRTSHASGINNLIQECSAELEQTLGRHIQPTTYTDLYLLSGGNCNIKGNLLMFNGKLTDTYEITGITSMGTTLASATGPNVGDYHFDKDNRQIIRLNQWWELTPLAIKATLKTGLNDDGAVRKDIKRILIEMVAAKSGLWTSMVRTAEGDIQTVRGSVKDDIKSLIKRLTLRQI